ncbi:hypothetical protein E2C01_010289 [Portunus trituberculatus]|uniref:Uncharacterized protein n=1 Tax=Portunus trituberculatus TaxID=210409 RepID=A0A5B7D828_PORTR|nr:hypothetical protein [Portunus trituberculatus]
MSPSLHMKLLSEVSRKDSCVVVVLVLSQVQPGNGSEGCYVVLFQLSAGGLGSVVRLTSQGTAKPHASPQSCRHKATSGVLFWSLLVVAASGDDFSTSFLGCECWFPSSSSISSPPPPPPPLPPHVPPTVFSNFSIMSLCKGCVCKL